MIHIEPTSRGGRGKPSLAYDLTASLGSPGSDYNLLAASIAPRTLWVSYKCYESNQKLIIYTLSLTNQHLSLTQNRWLLALPLAKFAQVSKVVG